jgi:hypothetical protein
MKPRTRDPISPGRPTPPWLAGIVIGMTISTLAVGAVLLGTGMAIGQAISRPK